MVIRGNNQYDSLSVSHLSSSSIILLSVKYNSFMWKSINNYYLQLNVLIVSRLPVENRLIFIVNYCYKFIHNCIFNPMDRYENYTFVE